MDYILSHHKDEYEISWLVGADAYLDILKGLWKEVLKNIYIF